jgi:hypothetical protein
LGCTCPVGTRAHGRGFLLTLEGPLSWVPEDGLLHEPTEEVSHDQGKQLYSQLLRTLREAVPDPQRPAQAGAGQIL